MSRLVVVAGFLMAGGCVWGPKVKDHVPAQDGRGLGANVELKSPAVDGRGSFLNGELLEVKPAGLVLLVSNKLVYVTFVDIRSARFPHDRSATIGSRGVDTTLRERLRLQSRFPQGLSEDVQARLLELHGQDQIAIVEIE